MSSVNWKKVKSVSQAKALIRHNAVECRVNTNHSNPDIDANRTSRNLSLDGLTYEQRCQRYDTRVAECKANMTRVRSDAVTMISLNIKLPEGLVDASYEEQKRWCQHCYTVVSEFVGGINIVSATADFDEVHTYLDAETKEKRLSRPEVDIRFIPAIDGKLCAKKWETVSNMQRLNQEVENMTQKEFGMEFMTGRVPGKRSTESIKAQSQRLEIGELMIAKAKSLEAYEADLKEKRQMLVNEINFFLECRKLAEAENASREQYMSRIKFADGTTAADRFKQYRAKEQAEITLAEQRLFAIADAYNQQKSGEGCAEQEKTQRRYRGGDSA